MLSAGRIDWKYLLGLELTDPGLDASVPSEFRGRLVAGGAEEHLLDTLLPLCRDLKLLNARGRLRTNSTHVLGAVRFLNRLECVTETLRAALNALATAAPEWLRAEADPAWLDRYDRRAGDHEVPLGEAKRRAHAEQIGRDGHQVLAAIMAPGAPIWLRQIPAVELLRQAWVQNFCLIDDAPATGTEAPLRVRWRTDQEGFPPSLLMVASPYDPGVHYARKQSTISIGYKVHLTETCDDGGPHLIAHVETTPAPVVDRDSLEDIHAALEAKGLLADAHLADAGYVAADQLVASQKKGVTLLGRLPRIISGRPVQEKASRAGLPPRLGPGSSDLPGRASEQELESRLPSGTNRVQSSLLDNRLSTLSLEDTVYPKRAATAHAATTRGTRDAGGGSPARGAACLLKEYRQRAGIEGTISAGVRVLHLRRSRYIGLAKTHLQHVLTAAAMNLIRLGLGSLARRSHEPGNPPLPGS
jgi:IS5 family transposase